MKKISVITVVYNAENNIEKTVCSVLGQSTDDIEYIIKDGNSQDNTNSVIKRVIGKEISHKEISHSVSNDKGLYDAMNIAVASCTGEWVIFMNAGDTFVGETVVEEIFKDKSYENYDVLFGNAVVDEGGEQNIWEGSIEHITKNHPCHQACFYKRKILLNYPFNLKYKIAADYNQLLDIYISGGRFYRLNKNICIYPMDGISSTNFIERVREKREIDIEHNYVKMGNRINTLCDYFMAYLKHVVCKVIPLEKQRLFRKAYKKYIKKYR